MQKNGRFGENPSHGLQNESKMQLLKTHPHTSALRGYKPPGGTCKGEKEMKPTRKGLENNQTPSEATATSPAREGCTHVMHGRSRGGGENVSSEME